MLKAYPMSRRRLDLYSLLDHNNQTKYIHMIQNIIKASRECNYNRQTAQQILISLMIKYLADHTDEMTEMEELNFFENL